VRHANRRLCLSAPTIFRCRVKSSGPSNRRSVRRKHTPVQRGNYTPWLRGLVQIGLMAAGSGGGICPRRALQIPQTAKPPGGRLTDGFAFVLQDRCRCPPFPHAAFGRVVELGSFGFPKSRLGWLAKSFLLFSDGGGKRRGVSYSISTARITYINQCAVDPPNARTFSTLSEIVFVSCITCSLSLLYSSISRWMRSPSDRSFSRSR